jgi:hypothetical protein
MAEGLVKGEGFAIDANIMKADAIPAREVPRTEPIDREPADGQSSAVREHLEALEHTNPVAADTSDQAASSTPPKKISLTDPTARWIAAPAVARSFPTRRII